MAERLALPTSDHGVAGSNPAGGKIVPKPKRCFIAQSLSCSPFHRLEMTEILLKGRKTLTHPSSKQLAFSHNFFSRLRIWTYNFKGHRLSIKVPAKNLVLFFQLIYWTKLTKQLINGSIFVWICGVGKSIQDLLLNYSQRIFGAQWVTSL